MIFRNTVVALFFLSSMTANVVTAIRAPSSPSLSDEQIDSFTAAVGNSMIPASSELGGRLLSKARRLDDEIDYTWVKGYSIKFESCHTIQEFRMEGGGQSEDEDDASPLETSRLVKFKLCPTVEDDEDYEEFSGQYAYTSSCGKCQNGAEYLVEMREFLESYMDFHLTQKEYNCEQAEENCECGNDDDGCLDACYANANLDYCDEFASNDGDDNYEFDVDEFLECRNVVEGQNDDYYQQRLYVGAYCSSDGKSIHLGEFTDRQCTTPAESGAYYSMFGHYLPYQDKSIVNGYECLSCLEPPENDDDANQDNQDDDEVREICEELYERSAKCEEDLAEGVATTQMNGACDYMHYTLPQSEKIAIANINGNQKSSSFDMSTFLACLFFVSTMGAAAYAFTLHQKFVSKSSKIDLSQSDGEVA